MLKYQIKIIDNYIDFLDQAHSVINTQLFEGQISEIPDLLQLCQEGMIKIGEMIEKNEGNDFLGIRDMETYCEYLYIISQNIDNIEVYKEYQQKLTDIFQKINDQIHNIAVKKEVVFFPYNASMWDSLESIWIAADKDPDCKTYVIPIPYYDIKNKGQEIVEIYEGDKFPSYVPITDYHAYQLAEHQPDIAYIHNPYDRFNNVTSVHPDYYSNELKKNVTKLVYVPYFLANDAVSFVHRELPSYYYVDNIVVQSEKVIDSFAPTIAREKFLPVGSPIEDRILSLNRNKPKIPDSWKPMLANGTDFGGKKVVMFNTSISMMLTERDSFLDKIEYVIHTFCKMSEIIMLWRPHPLMHATLQKMGNEYYQRFLEIEKMFLEDHVGILDKTNDVGIAVALCDAYVGEAASSVIYMFGIMRKPRFFIDMKLYEETSLEEECKVTSFGSYTEEDIEYFAIEEYHYLCKLKEAEGEIEAVAQIPGSKRYPFGAYKDIYKRGDNIYIQPYSGQGIVIYNTKEDSFRKIYVRDSVPYSFWRMLPDRDALYLLPKEYSHIVRFDLNTEEIQYYPPEEEEVPLIVNEAKSNKNELEETTYQLSEQTLRLIKAEEIGQRISGNFIWENEENKLKDFLYYISAKELYHWGQSQQSENTISAADKTCGEKIHEIMKNSLK